jgi:hypothetical protein
MIDQEKSPLKIESVHWSEIQNPCIRDMESAVLTDGKSTYRNQKVLFKMESVKVHARHPEIVAYDRSYIGYLLMQAIAPILSSRYDGTERDMADATDDTDFLANILELFVKSYWELIQNYTNLETNASDAGVEIDVNPRTLLRTYKHLISFRNRIDGIL